jgi:hypothetical protein
MAPFTGDMPPAGLVSSVLYKPLVTLRARCRTNYHRCQPKSRCQLRRDARKSVLRSTLTTGGGVMNRPNSATTQPTLLRTGHCGGGPECLYGAGSTKGALVRSLGRAGVSWDSAAAELFWATSNVEFYDPALVQHGNNYTDIAVRTSLKVTVDGVLGCCD